ncbi:flagellar hook-length control protein FliK [Clostridium sp. 'deep sea']|uniref:flagellar hook-length control protein FliK n=1 Tax=Clostridium sp. 'deep sea' TaxID=2779445 RepID=UPI0018967FC4|nr:flagellar hook-length control protein FliK [Clostridium sp. 'deep sea']QOR35346.1 flagellar hook-length control protein FliK [Clostridium sp. 'deep sea']
MINSMELLLSTATKVDSKLANKYGSDRAENGFENELKKELDLLPEQNKVSAEAADKEPEEVDQSDEKNQITEDSEPQEIIDLLSLQNQIVVLNVNQDSQQKTTTELTTSDPEHSESVASEATKVDQSEILVAKEFNTEPETDKDSQIRALTDSVSVNKDDNNNVFEEVELQDKIFNTKLQRLIKANKNKQLFNAEKNTAEVKPKTDSDLLQRTEQQKTSAMNNLHSETNEKESSREFIAQLLKSEQPLNKEVSDSRVLNTPLASNVKVAPSFQSASVETQQQFSEELFSAEPKTGESIMNQMTESISYGKLADGEYMHVKLKPDYLGAMSINIQKTQSGSVLNIQVESEAVKRMLNEKVEDMISVLSNKSVTIDKVQITTDYQNTNSDLSQQLNQHSFTGSQQQDQQQQEAKRDYMILDAVPSNNQSEQPEVIQTANKVSIYI